jgi:hypothetical protein
VGETVNTAVGPHRQQPLRCGRWQREAQRQQGVGTASSRDRKAVFGVALPASAEAKVGSALDSGVSNFCATTSPNDCKVGGTVNTAVGGHRQQPLHC